MSLPRLPYVVLDTNTMRRSEVVDPLLEDFDTTAVQIVLPWTMRVETYKPRTQTFWSATEHLSKRADAVVLAHASMTLFQTIELPFRRMVDDVVDHKSTASFQAILRDYNAGAIDYARADAALDGVYHQARQLVNPWGPILQQLVPLFTIDGAERAGIRKAIAAGNRQPYLERLATWTSREKIAEFLRGIHVDGKLIPYATAGRLASFPSFAALMFLANAARAFHWRLFGGVEQSKNLVNDGIDIENVLIALYGRDFISRDQKAHDLYEDLKAIVVMLWP